MADGYGLITSDPVISREMAKRKAEEEAARKAAYDASPEGRRKAEIIRREADLIQQGRRQASDKEAADRKHDGQLSHPRTRMPKTVQVDGADTPIDEAISKIPDQMDLEQRVLSSRILQRALRRRRMEDLIDEGKSPEEAEQTAIREQEGRAAAYKLGQETIRNSPDYSAKESRALGSGLTNSAVSFGARLLGLNQVADEAEATRAGLAAEMSSVREQQHPYPEVMGALAGAAESSIQMIPGMIASPVAGPTAGMAIMAGQFGTQEYSNAKYEGAEAGLSGDELNQYAAIQGGVEASIMPIFSKIPGLAGIEGRVLRQNIARTMASNPKLRQAIASGAVKLTKDLASELGEEITTEVLHGFATEKGLNQKVDYPSVIKDTVLQTLVMMGSAQIGESIGTAAGKGDLFGMRKQPAQQAPEVPAAESQQPIPPEVETFINSESPSRKQYEAAVKAGLPPLEKSTETTRKQYAADLLRDPFGMRKPDLSDSSPTPGTATPPAATPDPATLEPVIGDRAIQDMNASLPRPSVSPESIIGDRKYQPNQPMQNPVMNAPDEVQQSRTEPPAGTQDSAPPAAVNDSPTPAAHTNREDFEREYRDTYAKMMEYTPDQAGSQYYSDKMADLWDANPEWAQEIEETKTPPGASSPGGALPDQQSPRIADPVSTPEPEAITYHSGLSRSPAEVDEAINTKTPVGVSAFNSLSAPMRKKLVDYANADGKVFVDSGAFTAFRKGQEVDWDRTLFAYHELLTSVAPDKRKNLTIVAPDIVGDHDRTMELQSNLIEKFTPIIELGGQVIVPVQKDKGGGKLWEHWSDATDSFTPEQNDSFVVGVPFNEAAWSQDDVLDFMRARDRDANRFNVPPTPFHLLGGGTPQLKKLFEAAEAEGLSTEGISGDALPKKISQRKRKAVTTEDDPRPITYRVRDAIIAKAKTGLNEMSPESEIESAFKKAARAVFNDGLAGDRKDWFQTADMKAWANRTKKFWQKSLPKSDFPAAKNSLRSVVLSEGGISAKSLRGDYNAKELKETGFYRVMRVASKITLDEMADMLEASGHLRTPENRTPADWLKEQIQNNADSALAQYSDAEIEAQLEAERKAHEQLQETLKAEGIDTAGLEELRKNSIEAGFNEGDEISDEQADELIDTSFDFGANVAARAGDIVEFTAIDGTKKVGLVTKIRPDGRVFIEPERRTDSVGRKTSTRYSGMELRAPGEFTKIGTSPFPATLNQFYSKWEGKAEPDIEAEFTTLWDSLDADDKGRLAGRLRKFGITAKVNSATDKLASAVAKRLVDSRGIPGKIREIYDIAMEYPNLQGSFDNAETGKAHSEMMMRIDAVGLTLPPMVRAAMVLPEERRNLLHDLAKTQFGEDIADNLFEDVAAESQSDEDAFTLKRPEKPKPKPADFGTNPNTKQGGLFDAGKKGDKKGQELLFNSDPGDLNNPRTQENKPKVEPPAQSQAEPSQEDLMEQILREELMGETPAETAKPTKAAKPKTKPKSGAIEVIESRGAKMERSKGLIKAGLMAVDDRVSFVDYTGKTLTGTITAVDSEDGNVRVSVDQVKKAGGVPIGRVLYKEAVDLTNLTQAKRTEPASKPKTKKTSKDTAKALDDAVIDFGKSFGTTANTGLSPDQMRATAKLVRAAIEHGTKTFEEFVEFVVKKFNATVALQAAEGIELAWRSLKRLPEYSGIDDPGKVADVLGQKTGWAAVPQHFANQLANGKSYKSITEARSEASEIVGSPVKPGTADAKTLDEAIEYGIVQAGRMIVEAGGTPGAIYDKLVDMYERQPVLGVRNSTSMILQAYSTPVPLAWLVSNLGNVTADTKVYEPTAGNGMLLIGTDVKNAFANELDPDRAKILRDQGFNVTENDAANTASPEVDVVLANPPFGKVKDADRKTIEFNVDGFKTTEIDHAIALQSLKGMKPDGHTVLILAAKGHDAKTDLERRTAYSKGKDRPFYDALYQGYDVTEHFTVDGSLYSRQGASFPVDVIVLRPRGTVSMDQKRATPWAMVPRIFNAWGDIKNAFFNEMADSGSGTGVLSGNGDNRSSDLSTGNADDMGRIPGPNENTTSMAEGNVNASESESVVSTPVDGKTGGRRGSKKSGGSRSQSGLPTTAADKRSGKGNVSDSSEAGTVSKGLDSGTRPDGMAGTSAAESEVDPESHQSAYEPSSKNKNVETLVPTNLQDAIRTALENVEDAHGPIDAFVQKELGYKPNDKFFNDLSAEQVDAIALAVHSHQRGAGMVVGDMTGVGKGRVAAAMMRYAERQGLVPVFITEKPDLFGDMYRDLSDIGSDSAEAPFFAQPTNDTAGSKAIDLPDGRKLKSSKETAIARIDEALISLKAGNGFKAMVDGVPTKINAVFTMYTQLQTVDGKETRRREQLRDLMPHAFLIMDESHNAGGTVKERVNENAPPDRAALAREFVQSSAGTMYLSATFAKRPDVMDLYSKTDMAKAVDGDITKLASVIQTGGLPLQQVLSAMLGESGQYIRREKSFAGIEFSKVDVGVNLDEQDKITGVFRGIRTLDGAINEIVTGMNDELVAAGEHGVAGDVSTGDAGMTSNSFSSILWNAVDQMLFALKADKAADNAIESWKNGETPILAVDNTMERIIDEYVEENELKVGDVVNLTFRNILHRYLERSRWITIDTGMRDERGKKINRKERLTDDQLNVETPIGNALTMFNAAYDAIEATNIDAPASPIDWMRHKMQKAGMKIAEITGRSTILVYSDAGVATLGARPKSEKGTRGKQETIRRINDGSLDGLLLNRSGATGVSIHASSKFKNQKVRHMMIVQPAKNIDEFMQMLGRVNRTGQVVKPRYSLLMSDSPAELRPAAVLSKKLASLNASVTAKSKGAVGFTVTDVMNQVGGAIVSQYLVDNPEFAMSLDMSMEELNDDTEVDTLEDVVRKATGRSSILPITQQREFWDDITAAYNARIEELNALNANPLIAQTMDLDARTLSSVNLFAGKPDDGPFAAPANIERMDVRNPGKPMTPNQVKGKIQEFYDITNIDDRHGAAIKWERATVESLQEEMPAFHAYAVKNLVNPEAVIARHSKLHEQTESVIEAINTFAPGTVIEYVMDGMPFSGVVIGFKRTGRTGNPSAPSRWMIEIAINDSARKLNVPVSRSSNLFVKNESIDSVLESFEYAQTQSREKRWMGTGNLVAAYAQLSARNGKLIFYTDDQGNTKRGILMPRAFDATSFLEGKAVQFKTSGDILTFFDSGGQRIVSADGNLIIVKPDDKIVFQAPRARQRGGKYTLNRGIIAAAQQDFVSVGNNMVLRSSNREQQRRILDAVLDVTALEARNDTDRDLARSILGITNEETPAGTPGTATPDPSAGSADAPVSDSQKAVNDARAAVDAQKAENDRQDDIIVRELRKPGTAGSGIPITSELAKALAKRTLGAIKLGAKQFDLFIKELRRKYSEDEIKLLKPQLISVWNVFSGKYDLDEATSAGFDEAMSNTVDMEIEQAIEAITPAESQNREPAIAEPSTPTPDPATQPAATGDGRTYSTKLAATDAERERLAMGERPAKERQLRQASIDSAAAFGKTEAGQTHIDTLISELSVRPRATTPFENDLLNFRYAEHDQKYESALNQQRDGWVNGDDVQESIGEREASLNLKAMMELIEITSGGVSYALGAGLQARKAIINRDFSMARSVLEYEAAFKRKLDPNNPADKAIMDDMQKEISDLKAEQEKLQALIDEQTETIDDLQDRLGEAHTDAVDKVSKKPANKPESEPESSPRTKAAREKIDNAYKRLKKMLQEGMAFSVGGALGETGAVFIDLATGYSELGVINLGTFLNRVTKRMGPAAKKLIPQLTAAWKQVRATADMENTSSITDRIDRDSPDTIGRAARDLHAFVIERDGLDASPEGREAAVAAVHEILVDIIPELTLEETARAMSGIGIYSELSDNEIDVIRRDQKAQLLLLQQISDWKQGTPPPATGQERAPVSDEQRALRKAVNEAKKASGIETTTEGQLRSALDAAKRMLTNRIADLKKAIAENERITRSKKVLEDPSGELSALQAERDAQQKLYNETFGKNELSDEQRLNLAEKALDRAISNLEADLKADKLYPDAPKARATSPEIEAKRAVLDALKASRDEMRRQSGQEQERSDAAYERHLLERDAELARQLAEPVGKRAPKKPERVLTPAMLKTMLSIQKKQEALLKRRRDWEFQNRHIIYKAWMKGPVMVKGMVRKGLTTIDQSLIARQGWLLGITHPIIYGKSIRQAFASNMLEAKSIFPTEQDVFNTEAALDADANWVRLEKIGKVAVTGVHGGMKKTEENYSDVPEWFDKIPGIGGSERAGSAFSNTQRRLVFRELVKQLATKQGLQSESSISSADLRIIGNLVNVASGRASLGRWENAIEAATNVFFSPRWWASRIQILTGQPLWKDARWTGGEGASTEVRLLVAKEWASQAFAQAAIMTLAVAGLKAAFGAPGDDEEWDWYADWKNPNFGRIRIGSTYIDMTAGLGQHIALLGRMITGKQVNRWETEDVDRFRMVTNHIRGKLAPTPGIFADWLDGQSIGQDPFGSKEWFAGKAVPLSIQDVAKTMKEESIPIGLLVSAMMFFGMGAQTREARIKARTDVANELRAMQKQKASPEKIQKTLNDHLKHTAKLEANEKLRTANPEEVSALEKVVSGESSAEMTEAIQKEKYDITLRALEMLSTEDLTKKKKAGEDKGIETARTLLRTIAPTFEDADALFKSAYMQRNGLLVEKVGKTYRPKKSVNASRYRLMQIYETK